MQTDSRKFLNLLAPETPQQIWVLVPLQSVRARAAPRSEEHHRESKAASWPRASKNQYSCFCSLREIPQLIKEIIWFLQNRALPEICALGKFLKNRCISFPSKLYFCYYQDFLEMEIRHSKQLGRLEPSHIYTTRSVFFQWCWSVKHTQVLQLTQG